MDEIKIIDICKDVLRHLCGMGFEQNNICSSGQLIFPMKREADGTKHTDRISEQELRLLFIDEFKAKYNHLFYSIETPTVLKYSFGKLYEDIKLDLKGQSASIDMCIFERASEEYQRILNVEFKSGNPPIKHTAKDILKLISEKRDGAFIHLLHNTDSGTFCNNNGTGVFNKYYDSFLNFKAGWNDQKSIHFIIISLSQQTLLYREIKNQDLNNLTNIFFIEKGCGNIKEVRGNGWINETIEKS